MERDQPHPLIGKYTQTKVTSQHTLYHIPTTTTTQTASTKYTHTHTTIDKLDWLTFILANLGGNYACPQFIMFAQ